MPDFSSATNSPTIHHPHAIIHTLQDLLVTMDQVSAVQAEPESCQSWLDDSSTNATHGQAVPTEESPELVQAGSGSVVGQVVPGQSEVKPKDDKDVDIVSQMEVDKVDSWLTFICE